MPKNSSKPVKLSEAQIREMDAMFPEPVPSDIWCPDEKSQLEAQAEVGFQPDPPRKSKKQVHLHIH